MTTISCSGSSRGEEQRRGLEIELLLERRHVRRGGRRSEVLALISCPLVAEHASARAGGQRPQRRRQLVHRRLEDALQQRRDERLQPADEPATRGWSDEAPFFAIVDRPLRDALHLVPEPAEEALEVGSRPVPFGSNARRSRRPGARSATRRTSLRRSAMPSSICLRRGRARARLHSLQELLGAPAERRSLRTARPAGRRFRHASWRAPRASHLVSYRSNKSSRSSSDKRASVDPRRTRDERRLEGRRTPRGRTRLERGRSLNIALLERTTAEHCSRSPSPPSARTPLLVTRSSRFLLGDAPV